MNISTELLFETLKKYKNEFPFLRLGQIISNISASRGIDVFYLEDTDLIKELESHLNK